MSNVRSYKSMSMEDVVKASLSGSEVTLECSKGNRVVCSKVRLECLRRCLKSVHH